MPMENTNESTFKENVMTEKWKLKNIKAEDPDLYREIMMWDDLDDSNDFLEEKIESPKDNPEF